MGNLEVLALQGVSVESISVISNYYFYQTVIVSGLAAFSALLALIACGIMCKRR